MDSEALIENIIKETDHSLDSIYEILGVKLDSDTGLIKSNNYEKRISLLKDFLSKYSLNR